jgi:acyl-CoA synthetase (AMP-forming)/AMP-acid ligase II
MPHLKSLYPDIPPLSLNLNIWDSILGQPHQANFPDYTVHQDLETGKTYTYKELRKRVDDLAASLGRAVSEGGLGLGREKREMIGIMSDNSSVCTNTSMCERENRTKIGTRISWSLQ